MFYGDTLILLIFLLSNYLLLKYYNRPPVNSDFYAMTLLPLSLFMDFGFSLPSISFSLICVFIVLLKHKTTRNILIEENFMFLVLVFFIILFLIFCWADSLFSFYLAVEYAFVVSLFMLIRGGLRNYNVDFYALPNLAIGLTFAADIFSIVAATGKVTLDISTVNNITEHMNGSPFIANFIFFVLLFIACFKLYVIPGNLYVPGMYQNMNTTQVALFSTIFSLPYMYLALVFFSSLSGPAQIMIFCMIGFTIIWCFVQLSSEFRLKPIIGFLTIFTQNILLLILISGPSFISSHYIHLTFIFLLFYLMSLMPFLYLLSRSDCNGFLEMRLAVFLMNTFSSYVFYLSWLSLAGLPLTFLFVTKLITLTQLLGIMTSGFLFWLYLLFSFYLYVVFFLFFILSKEIYLLHRKDLAQERGEEEDDPLITSAIGIFPWVLLVFLFLLFVFFAALFF